MVRRSQAPALYDPREGGQPMQVEGLRLGRTPYDPPRTNCFSVYWVLAGRGLVWAGTAQHSFSPRSLLFFTPYQYLRFAPEHEVRGEIIRFHANFLCVETFHSEVGCSGTLFNDPYGSPILKLSREAADEIADLIVRMRHEQAEAGLAHEEAILAYLKVLLIKATRVKDATGACVAGGDPRHPVLAELRTLIERHFHELHAPADYARLLHMTPKSLGRMVREQLGKTLTDLIRDRILTHAKWQLLHTLKPVKQVAREVGFRDELYFSRLFKKATGFSPTFFREFETEIRGGSNLSMLSGAAPILAPASGSDNSDID